jgi:molecular chaperone DnaJ
MAARIPDLYAVLGVTSEASGEDIKRAYRQLARELHPDVNADPQAEQRFKEITAAYDTLSDPAKRRRYDTFGRQGAAGGDPFGFGGFGDLSDIFEVFFGGGVGARRRGSRSRRGRARRGEDVAVTVSLSFQEAAFGLATQVTVETLAACGTCGGTGCEPGTTAERCSRCGGAGEVQDVTQSIFGTVMTARPCQVCEGAGEVVSSPCSTCRGEGRIPERRTIPIEVPPGVDDGMELRVSGAGRAGRAGGGAGDLYVRLGVEPHPVFERRGQDLVCVLPVPMTVAALGAEVKIATLDGEESLRIEPGTPSGHVMRLRGRGIPNLERRGRGDLYVTVVVETPKPASKQERILLEQLAEARGERPDKGRGLGGRLRRPLEP